MNKSTLFFVIGFLFFGINSQSQNFESDSLMLQKIYRTALTDGKSYEWLDYISNNIGGRLSGSLQEEQIIAYTESQLNELGLDKVWKQPVMVPKWTRGFKEYAYIESSNGVKNVVDILALGGSVATPNLGIKAEVVEVKSLEEIEQLGKSKISGKIIFINRPMNPEHIHTFSAYGEVSRLRFYGAAEAAKYGAVGMIIRSLGLRHDDFPHTGVMSYGDLQEEKKIPAAAISTNGAEYLSNMLSLNPKLNFYFKINSKNWPDVQSYNVIGEIKGSEYPEKYMLVGAHLDSWDIGDGAHDDGAGVAQSMEVLRIFKKIGYQPKHTVRIVLFANEENGLRGARKYAEEAKQKNEKHLFALESDAGGFSPRGFSIDTDDANMEQLNNWKKLFEPYFIHVFRRGYSAPDLTPLKGYCDVLAGLLPDSQRYFDLHHTAEDTFDKINKRELELGAAAMASLLYLYDTYGTK